MDCRPPIRLVDESQMPSSIARGLRAGRTRYNSIPTTPRTRNTTAAPPGCCAIAQDSGVSEGEALSREAWEGDTGPAETGFGGERM